jgi:hypothetical protein
VDTKKEKEVSRRNLLKAVAGIGAAGAVVGVPGMVFFARGDEAARTAPVQGEAMTPADPAGFGSPLVAYVKDAASGEVVVMFGVEEIVVKDPQLVARLVGAVRG